MVKLERIVLPADNHGDRGDLPAQEEFFDFVKHFKPTIRGHLGDFVDLRALRRGADDEDKSDSISDDFNAGLDFLKRLDPQVVLLGNHDDRLWEWSQNHHNGAIRTLCSMLIDSIHDGLPKTKFIEHNKRTGIWKLGDYSMLHGYSAGLYALRQSVATYGRCAIGHIHSPGYFANPSLDGADGYSSGCLCALELGYNKKSPGTLRQQHGWIYGVKVHNRLQLWLARKVGDVWVYPSEIRVSSGETK